ncbi:MAG: GNAT family N-acetyltransferase [Cyanobacteria bacterium J06623_7]
MTEIEVTRATIDRLDDIAFLFDLYREFYHQTSDVTAAKKFIRERLQLQDAVIFLGTERGRPIGYTQLFPSWSSVLMGQVWILNDLFVLESSRNQGVARALMNRVADYERSTEAIRIILATEATNKIGQNLYESLGYQRLDSFYHHMLNLLS